MVLGGVVRLRVDLAYDGTPFHGFARQKDFPTVQGFLEEALQRVFGQDCETLGAGRTDRGVHALGQVVHFEVDLDHPDAAARRRARIMTGDLLKARARVDKEVGKRITIWRVSIVPEDFNARFSATRRHYRYRIVDDVAVDPRLRHVAWDVGGPLKLRPMQIGAKSLIGTHDFAALCRNRQKKTTMRRLVAITVARPEPGEINVKVQGNAFCHQQVRSIVGCLVSIGRGWESPEWLGEVLASKDRALAAAVAPPQGLVLERVAFGGKFPPSPYKL